MTNFIIKQTEPQLFTVGTEDGNGNWEPYKDFNTRQAANAWILRRSFIVSEKLEPQKIDKQYEIIIREHVPEMGQSGWKIVQDAEYYHFVVFSHKHPDQIYATFLDAGELFRYLVRECFCHAN
jgi:predicted N-acetyltransferase YhbS